MNAKLFVELYFGNPDEWPGSHQSLNFDELTEFLNEFIKNNLKNEIEEAWMDGNKKGWKMETDWPEDATRYFEENFNQS